MTTPDVMTTPAPASAVRRPAVARCGGESRTGPGQRLGGLRPLAARGAPASAVARGSSARVAVAAALITGWRVVGSAAVLLVGSTPLLAAALEEDAASTGRLVAATVLVLLLVVGLDGVERRDVRGPEPVVLRKSSPARQWLAPLVAVASCALLGAASAATFTPSVAFVLLGLLAGVGAVLAATRVH